MFLIRYGPTIKNSKKKIKDFKYLFLFLKMLHIIKTQNLSYTNDLHKGRFWNESPILTYLTNEK